MKFQAVLIKFFNISNKNTNKNFTTFYNGIKALGKCFTIDFVRFIIYASKLSFKKPRKNLQTSRNLRDNQHNSTMCKAECDGE